MPEDSTIPKFHLFVSGQRIDLNSLTPEQVDIRDIAHNLAILPRFAGNTSRPYSVAEHSLMVMQMVEEQGHGPDVMLQALLHDATEAFMGDVPAPVKCMVPEIRDFETRVLWPPIADRFGLDRDMHPSIKKADWAAFYVEAHCLCSAKDLSEWENYEDYMPIAEAWIEAQGELAASEMPHPGMIMDVFLQCFETLIAARREGAS